MVTGSMTAVVVRWWVKAESRATDRMSTTRTPVRLQDDQDGDDIVTQRLRDQQRERGAEDREVDQLGSREGVEHAVLAVHRRRSRAGGARPVPAAIGAAIVQ